FNFRDVPHFAAAAHPFLVEIQRDLRSQQRVFGLCGLRPEVRTTLTGAGIVRDGEIFNNVPVAWKRLKKS
ncbi:MAG: STAS domain-containing protein, partial [Bdellovibrionia bacterium]